MLKPQILHSAACSNLLLVLKEDQYLSHAPCPCSAGSTACLTCSHSLTYALRLSLLTQLRVQTNGAAPPSTKSKPKAAPKSSSDTHTIDITETFYARSQDIYECFTQAGKIQAFTQSPAQAQPQVGGKFSMFGGSVQGSYEELTPFSRLRLDWRFGNWPDDAKSQVGCNLCWQFASFQTWHTMPSRTVQMAQPSHSHRHAVSLRCMQCAECSASSLYSKLALQAGSTAST